MVKLIRIGRQGSIANFYAPAKQGAEGDKVLAFLSELNRNYSANEPFSMPTGEIKTQLEEVSLMDPKGNNINIDGLADSIEFSKQVSEELASQGKSILYWSKSDNGFTDFHKWHQALTAYKTQLRARDTQCQPVDGEDQTDRLSIKEGKLVVDEDQKIPDLIYVATVGEEDPRYGYVSLAEFLEFNNKVEPVYPANKQGAFCEYKANLIQYAFRDAYNRNTDDFRLRKYKLWADYAAQHPLGTDRAMPKLRSQSTSI